MSEWQDISTAPKDGTIILVCGTSATKKYYVADAKWSDGAWMLYDPAEETGDGYSVASVGHTHWMPLPEPPK